MKAAVFREVNVPMEIEDVTVSKPGPREVLIRTQAAGICHSDMHFFNGSYPGKLPMVLGHESAGIVEQVGSDVHYVKPGDHVITCLSVFCGHCEQCLTGHLSLCQEPETNRTKDEEPRLSQSEQPLTPFAQLGSFAEMMLVHEHALVKVREDMPTVCLQSMALHWPVHLALLRWTWCLQSWSLRVNSGLRIWWTPVTARPSKR